MKLKENSSWFEDSSTTGHGEELSGFWAIKDSSQIQRLVDLKLFKSFYVT